MELELKKGIEIQKQTAVIKRLPTKAVHRTESKPRTNSERSISKSAGRRYMIYIKIRQDINGERNTEVESLAKLINKDAK